jgi:hypothetical protein
MASQKIIKDQVQKLTFGDYDNTGNMIPRELQKIERYSSGSLFAHILWDYNDKTGRTIVLCEEDLDNIDYESFGTTFEKELAKIGLKPEEVQKRRYGRFQVISQPDGSIIPFSDYTVEFDFVNRKGFPYHHEKVDVYDVQGEEKAIQYVKNSNSSYGSYVTNFRVTPKK